MGRNNKVRKFAEMKRTLKAKDKRLKQPEKKKKLGYFPYSITRPLEIVQPETVFFS